MTLACLNGELMPVEEARIPVTDEGLLRGDGVFEVIRLYDGHPYALDDHLRRMQRSADNLRLPIDVGAVREDAAALLRAEDPGDSVLRVLVTRGGRRIALIETLPDMPATIALGVVTYAPTRVLDAVKSLSYAANMLCSRLARERGFDEALLVTPHGRVLEGPTSSFFYVRDGQLLTPPLEDHVLDSITRRAVFAVADPIEQPASLDDLRGVEEAFLVSTLREGMPVRAIEDIELAAPGPVTAEVAAALQAHIAAEVAASLAA
jgi:branched-chain amino acid aminotransferase